MVLALLSLLVSHAQNLRKNMFHHHFPPHQELDYLDYHNFRADMNHKQAYMVAHNACNCIAAFGSWSYNYNGPY